MMYIGRADADVTQGKRSIKSKAKGFVKEKNNGRGGVKMQKLTESDAEHAIVQRQKEKLKPSALGKKKKVVRGAETRKKQGSDDAGIKAGFRIKKKH